MAVTGSLAPTLIAASTKTVRWSSGPKKRCCFSTRTPRFRRRGVASASSAGARCRTVRHVAADLFGEAVDMDGDQFWTGLRPMTPDSVPVVGATPYGNLFLNTGQGTLGWTMSCGSSRLVADMVSGRQTEISSDGLQMSRYGFANRVRSARSERPLRTAAAH